MRRRAGDDSASPARTHRWREHVVAVDFNRVIDRTGTYSTQWDYAADRFGRADVLPFSISDTDFPVPEEVEEALLERLRHPIFGYTRWNHADYKQSVIRWFQRDGSAQGFDPEWVVYSPSVIFSVASVVRLLTAPGEGVITCTPMYDAFYGVIEGNGRRIAAVRQASAMEGYGLDWDALERAASDPRNRVMLLTNPHNPTGKVYTADELARIHGICREHGVTLISDDIHRDVVYAPARYTPVLDVSTEGALIACSSSKTFNTPGLVGSYCLIPDPVLRERFLFELKQRNALSSVSVPGMVAQMAAYARCDAYVSDMVEHLAHNMARGRVRREGGPRRLLRGAPGHLPRLDGRLGPGHERGRGPGPARQPRARGHHVRRRLRRRALPAHERRLPALQARRRARAHAQGPRRVGTPGGSHAPHQTREDARLAAALAAAHGRGAGGGPRGLAPDRRA